MFALTDEKEVDDSNTREKKSNFHCEGINRIYCYVIHVDIGLVKCLCILFVCLARLAHDIRAMQTKPTAHQNSTERHIPRNRD